MRLRCIIIDDEQTGIETLSFLVHKYIDDVKVVAHSTSPREAIGLIEDYKPEIVFLDITMPEMNGFELLEQLSWKNFNLVFTTAHREHALQALKLSAADYLLKPIDPGDLVAAVNKIKNQLATQNNAGTFNYTALNSINQYYTNKMAVNAKTGIEYIDPLDIVSLESKSNYTQMYLNDSGVILTPKTLRDFDTQLCANNSFIFMRVHHSFVVNLHKILRYVKEDDTIIMSNNQKIPLSKSKKETFFKWLKVQ